ncbi:ribonuclease T2 [Mesorhizobium sp. BE184]|uniref:ribonuclease T2 n=1 Tax=Mesorhizobium sp. BE184 TaxID=2817714 RepID=UPI00285E8387|nr:ribonuclease T2 [Mesorhizobium sp. BE184]MDR7032364.1 ribonuclease T2 [Mesorhizobium sp. BE184]
MSGLRRRLLPAVLASLALLAVACAPADDGKPREKNAPAGPGQKTSSKEQAPVKGESIPAGSGFDFYVLSLSWSPSYCEAEGADANRQQCGAARPYAFIVHGLWPQFERGFPQDCPTDRSKVPDATVRSLYDLMPSAGLIRHEWQTHGTCSGLGQQDYFRVLRAAREKVAIPPAFRRLNDYRTLSPQDAETAFQESNPDLPPDAIAVTCDRRYLREVRICLTRNLEFRACPEIDRKACRASKVVMPPVRASSNTR